VAVDVAAAVGVVVAAVRVLVAAVVEVDDFVAVLLVADDVVTAAAFDAAV
jgi:hypothetical protein